MIACYKKAGLEPPAFTKPIPKPPEHPDAGAGGSSRPKKPLLFVCKTCNRAFSMRCNMMQHAIACMKKNKDKGWYDPKKATADSDEPAKKSEKSAAKESSDVKNAESTSPSPVPMTVEELPEDDTVLRDGYEAKVSPKYYQDDMLFQLSPSDEAREEERSQTPPATPASIAQSRPKRNVKPKMFYDGERVKIPEVVKIQQADGSLVYKLREDVENPSKKTTDKTCEWICIIILIKSWL